MNIVVIISDTLRRDRLGCYGNTHIHTPHLARFAQRSVVFDRAYCASFPTVPMRADIMTGRFTFNYLGWAPLPSNETTLQKLLTNAGYKTMGIADTPFLLRNGYGYDNGFHDFRWVRGQGGYIAPKSMPGDWGDWEDTNYERRYEEDHCAPKTFAHAERWLERHYKEKFFLYIDTWDPHEPWDPPSHYIELYKPDWNGEFIRPPYGYWEEEGLTQDQVDTANACYNGEVTMVDHAFGRFIDRLESMKLLDDTMIIFTSDHGFCLGEHGILGKSLTKKGSFMASPLYEEITGIPLLVYIPGITPNKTSALVTVPDIMPTILELSNMQIPETVQGKSFLPVLKGERNQHRDYTVSSMHLRNPGETTRSIDNIERKIEQYLTATITTDEWALFYAWEGAKAQLFNLKNDPKQEYNVIGEFTEVARGLHRTYFEFLKEIGTEDRLLEPRIRL